MQSANCDDDLIVLCLKFTCQMPIAVEIYNVIRLRQKQ